MLRGDLQISADMMLSQFFDIQRILYCQIVTHPGGDQDLLDAFERPCASVQFDGRRMVSVHVATDFRVNTGSPAAGLFSAWRLAAQHIHVGRRSAEIGDHPGKADRKSTRLNSSHTVISY